MPLTDKEVQTLAEIAERLSRDRCTAYTAFGKQIHHNGDPCPVHPSVEHNQAALDLVRLSREKLTHFIVTHNLAVDTEQLANIDGLLAAAARSLIAARVA